MSPPPPLFYLAGVVHLVVASANLVAFGKFGYLEHLRDVPPVVRQVFLVQNGYLMLIQVGFALLCFGFAAELGSGRPLSVALTGFLALFWGSRVLLQLFYYDRAVRRANRMFDVLFVAADGYLCAVYALAALAPRP